MDFSVKKLTAADLAEFAAMLRLFEEVFEMKDYIMPEEKYLEILLENNDFIVYVAIHENKIVGGLTAFTIASYYFESSEVYIYDLAVKASYQRQGIGKKLVQSIAEYCLEHKYREFFVQADEIDTHALEFYRATGGRPEKVVHFYYPINSFPDQ